MDVVIKTLIALIKSHASTRFKRIPPYLGAPENFGAKHRDLHTFQLG
jgi:hypothetical protein